MAAPKKVLFVMPSLDAGGGEKSLVSLLAALDPGKVAPSLLLLHDRGVFRNIVPGHVDIVSPGKDWEIFSRPLLKSMAAFLMAGKWKLALSRFRFSRLHRREANRDRAEQLAWRYLSPAMPKVAGSFDAAVGFMEKTSVYAAVDKVEAPVKIGWIHTNYDSSGMDAALDRPYFRKLQHLVTVSESCRDALLGNFPDIADKISVIRNIISPALIEHLAAQPVPETPFSGITIVSVGRLSREKGFDIAVEAAAQLKRSGLDFRWFIIGDGPESETLKATVDQLGLTGIVRFPGILANPYPYVRMADIYVQPSRYEGRSIAIDEALALRRPIVATAFSTVADQLEAGKTAVVCGMDAASVAEAVNDLARHPEKRAALSGRIDRATVSTETEVEKFYNLLP